MGAGMAAMQGAGSLLSMYGAYQQSKEEEATARYNAKVALLRGEEEQAAVEAETRIQAQADRAGLSDARARSGASGVIQSVGSPLVVAAGAVADAEADRNEMIRQGEIARIKGKTLSDEYTKTADSLEDNRWLNVISAGMGGMTSAAGSMGK